MEHKAKLQKRVLYLSALLAVIVQVGCTAGDSRFTAEDPAGFFQGLWHGVIAVVDQERIGHVAQFTEGVLITVSQWLAREIRRGHYQWPQTLGKQ